MEYITEIDDRTTCFHCGGSLYDWDESADPWFEHVRWFPDCQFLKLMKGQRYLDECRARQNSISSVKVTNFHLKIINLRGYCDHKF